MKKIILSLILLSLFIRHSTADLIQLKNGKKYDGVLIEFAVGKYTFKIGEKKYFIPEYTIQNISWDVSQPQLCEAYRGETLTDVLRAHSRNLWMFAEPSAGMLLIGNKTDGIAKGVMMLSGVGFGFQGKTGVSMGSLDGSVQGMEYFLPATADISLMYGSMPGTIKYRVPGAALDKITPIDASSLIFMINGGFRFNPGNSFLYLFGEAGFGGTLNFDKLDSYPLGWKTYDGYPAWMLNPDQITASKVSVAYFGIATRFMAGVQIEISELFFAGIAGGYLAYSRNRYNDPYKFDSSISMSDMSAAVNAGGEYFEISARFLF